MEPQIAMRFDLDTREDQLLLPFESGLCELKDFLSPQLLEYIKKGQLVRVDITKIGVVLRYSYL